MFYNFNQTFQMRQNCTSHQDWNPLQDLDVSMSSLPWLLAVTDSSSSCITNILIDIVNVWSHCWNHSCQSSSFSQISDDFPTFHPSIVVFISQQWLNHYKNLQDKNCCLTLRPSKQEVKHTIHYEEFLFYELRHVVLDKYQCCRQTGFHYLLWWWRQHVRPDHIGTLLPQHKAAQPRTQQAADTLLIKIPFCFSRILQRSIDYLN